MMLELVVSWSLSLKPGLHKQSDTAALPAVVVFESFGHRMHKVLPVVELYWPTMQSEQSDC